MEDNHGSSAAADEVVQQINKRLTLNLLIQGAAAHTFISTHYAVRDELEAIHPGLTRLYDRWAIGLHLNYWMGDIPLFFGRPARFWKRIGRSDHPFHRHLLLARHGAELSRASKRFLLSRGWRRGVIGFPIVHYLQTIWWFFRINKVEQPHRSRLLQLAKQVTSAIWDIDEHQLDADFTKDVAFGNLSTPRTRVGRLVQAAAIGFGGVERRGDRFYVVAKSWNWPTVIHELVKGTAELVCLHGLRDLSDTMYAQVTDEADQIEYETWLLQAGAEMWRKFLAVLPDDRGLAEMLMHVARLAPAELEGLMLCIIEEPDDARRHLWSLGRVDEER